MTRNVPGADPDSLVLHDLEFNKDGRFYCPLMVYPVDRSPGRPKDSAMLRKIKVALRVEAWLAIEQLSTLDIRSLLHSNDEGDVYRPTPDRRSKSERRRDAETLIENLLGSKRLETIKSRGRQEVEGRYNKPTRYINKYVRDGATRFFRDADPYATDTLIAEELLKKITALLRAEAKMEELLSFTKVARDHGEYLTKMAKSRICDIPVLRSKIDFDDRDQLMFISVYSGVNAADLWLNISRFRDLFECAVIYGRMLRHEKISKADEDFFDDKFRRFIIYRIIPANLYERKIREFLELIRDSDVRSRRLLGMTA